ncbi:MAG: asparaginase domain-containing protein, partial [Dialister sp.]|nr:asparaginase domain-containing protein [Dialister sp.]
MKKHIIVITTGGTIAMKTDPMTGGLVPAVSGEDLAAAVPGLSSWADVDVVEFSNVPSGWMDTEKMLSLARTIDGLADKADGFVVTHGTDSLEETAFFLDMTLHTEKPV